MIHCISAINAKQAAHTFDQEFQTQCFPLPTTEHFKVLVYRSCPPSGWVIFQASDRHTYMDGLYFTLENPLNIQQSCWGRDLSSYGN